MGNVRARIFGIAVALELRSSGHKVTVLEQAKAPNEKARSTDAPHPPREICEKFWGGGRNRPA